MLTGFFGKFCKQWVRDLATQTRAISWTPMFQAISCNGDEYFHPSFLMLYGYYKNISVPEEIPEADKEWIGSANDIWHDMLPLQGVPTWTLNDSGNPFVQHIGTVKMKTVPWPKWFPCCF